MSWWELPPADTGKVTEQYPHSPLTPPLPNTHTPALNTIINPVFLSLCPSFSLPHLALSHVTIPYTAFHFNLLFPFPFPPTNTQHCALLSLYSPTVQQPFPLVSKNHCNKSLQHKTHSHRPTHILTLTITFHFWGALWVCFLLKCAYLDQVY